MKKHPMIGVISAKYQYNILLPAFRTNAHYVEQVAATGAVPIQIPLLPAMEETVLQAIVAGCDGFLFPGGADFAPEWYGETLLEGLQPDSSGLDLDVQETAIRLIRLAVASGRPILGICLGLQVINVAMGGSLYQDIPLQFPTEIRHDSPAKQVSDRWKIAHNVRTEQGSLLRTITEAELLSVNSFHHQAIKSLAPGFRATAWAEDGLVEAMESDSKPILGVQWHPENLAHGGMPQAKALFQWLAEKAAE